MADDHWLRRKLIEENGLAYRTVWDLYLKFFTIFLTVNFAALGLTVQHVTRVNRWPLVVGFILQNVVSAWTAFAVARFSRSSAAKYETLCKLEAELELLPPKLPEALLTSPVPGWLGWQSGIANLVTHCALIFCWMAMIWV